MIGSGGNVLWILYILNQNYTPDLKPFPHQLRGVNKASKIINDVIICIKYQYVVDVHHKAPGSGTICIVLFPHHRMPFTVGSESWWSGWLCFSLIMGFKNGHYSQIEYAPKLYFFKE